jgi:prepilin peptidase CpaA
MRTIAPASLEIAAIGVLLLAALWDVVERRIPNAVSVVLLILGGSFQLLAGTAGSAGLALAGGALTFALLFAGWSLRLLGGGDVKFGAAAAVTVGWSRMPVYLAAAALAGGVAAIIAYVWSAREARQAMRANLLAIASKLAPGPAACTPGRVSIPYGVAFATGAVVALFWTR